MNDNLLTQLKHCGTVETDRQLAELTTFKIGGPVRFVVYPKSAFGLLKVIQIFNRNDIPYKVLGNGSNILASDRNYDGAIIKLNYGFNDYSFDGTVLMAQAGCSVIAMAYRACQAELSGLEFASGIPGSVGGCIFMNAGAYRSSMSAILTRVMVLKDEQFIWMNADECNFGYRSSIFQSHPELIIIDAQFQLKHENMDTIRQLMEQRQSKRLATQPLDMPCAGSVFRNPEGHYAWEFIDGIGYRGHAIGDAAVSQKHSNFIVNQGQAKAQQVVQLIEEIQKKVSEKYDVELIPEVERFNWPTK